MTSSVEIPETGKKQGITFECKAVIASLLLLTLNIQTAEYFPNIT